MPLATACQSYLQIKPCVSTIGLHQISLFLLKLCLSGCVHSRDMSCRCIENVSLGWGVPGRWVGPGDQNWTLAVKNEKTSNWSNYSVGQKEPRSQILNTKFSRSQSTSLWNKKGVVNKTKNCQKKFKICLASQKIWSEILLAEKKLWVEKKTCLKKIWPQKNSPGKKIQPEFFLGQNFFCPKTFSWIKIWLKRNFGCKKNVGPKNCRADFWVKSGREKQKKWPNISSFFVNKYRLKKIVYVPSSCAKILGETKFQLQEFPWSGSKAMSVEEEERAKVTDYNGQYICLNQ